MGKNRPLPAIPMLRLLPIALVLPLLLGALSVSPGERSLAEEVRFVTTGEVAVLPSRDRPHPFGLTIRPSKRRLAEAALERSRQEVARAQPRALGCARRPTLAEALARTVPPPRAQLDEALFNFEAGHLERAISLLQPLAGKPDPEIAPEATYWLAECRLATGEEAPARQGLTSLVERWPRHPLAPWAHYTLAWLAIEGGDATAAIPHLDAATAEAPSTLRPSLAVWRLKLALDSGDMKEAQAQIVTLLRSGPAAWQPSLTQIEMELLYHLGRFREAIALGAGSGGELPEVEQLTVAWCHLALGERDAAIPLLDRLQHRPGAVGLGGALGLFRAALDGGDLTAADNMITTPPLSEAGEPLLDARLKLAQAHLAAGETAAAMEGFQAILDAAPNSPSATRTRLSLARALFAAKEYTDAAETLRYLVVRGEGLNADEQAEARYLLARSLHLLGETRGAEEAYRTLRTGAPDSPWAHKARFYEALLYLGQNRLLETIPLLEGVARDDPNWAVAQEELGKAYLTLGNTGRAQAVFARAASEASPAERGDALFLLAETAFDNGDLTSAYDYYRQVTESHPDDARLQRSMVRMAHILAKRKDYRGSNALLTSLAARFPDSKVAAAALFSIGLNELDAGHTDQAVTALSRYIQRFPDGPQAGEALFRLAVAYKKGSKLEEAATTFVRAAEQATTPAQEVAARLAAAFALADLGRANEANDGLEAIFRDRLHDSDTLLAAVEALRSAGVRDYAAHALAEMEARFDDSRALAAVALARGTLQEDADDVDGAIATYATLLRNYPGQPATQEARLRMARLYLKRQESFLASQILRRCLDDPSDTAHHAEARLLLGRVYVALDLTDRALETLLPLVGKGEENPFRTQAAYEIGRILLHLGQAERAYPFFVEATRSGDLKILAVLPYYRGRCLVKMGRARQGIEELQTFVNSLPTDTALEIQAYLAMAKGYLAEGDSSAALRVLARANTLAEGTPFAEAVRALRLQLAAQAAGAQAAGVAPESTAAAATPATGGAEAAPLAAPAAPGAPPPPVEPPPTVPPPSSPAAP